MEVVDYLEPVMRKLDLWGEDRGATRVTCSSSMTPGPDCLITAAFRTTLLLSTAAYRTAHGRLGLARN